MTKIPPPTVAIFGATGAIGSVLCNWYENAGWLVTAIGRNKDFNRENNALTQYIQWDIKAKNPRTPENFPSKVNAVIWAQGANHSDSIHTFSRANFDQLIEANVLFILETLGSLLKSKNLNKNCKLVVISSIWQEIARNDKLSYMISKSALRGLVQSLAIDLAEDGYQINAVLPGVLDTPMTHANMTKSQIKTVLQHTPGGQTTTLEELCETVGFLTSQTDTGVNGQFVTLDKSFSKSVIL